MISDQLKMKKKSYLSFTLSISVDRRRNSGIKRATQAGSSPWQANESLCSKVL